MEGTEKEKTKSEGKLTLEESIDRVVSNPAFQENLKNLIYLKTIAEHSVREFNMAMEGFADRYPTVGGIIDLNLRLELIAETQPETKPTQ